MSAIYDRIGDGYDTTRRADPVILEVFRELLEVRSSGAYLFITAIKTPA